MNRELYLPKEWIDDIARPHAAKYDWARVPLLSWQMPGQQRLLLRRNRSDGKLAYYVCYTPPDTDLQTMAQVAGMRWMIKECFEAAKGEVGLDQYEVRRHCNGWYRHMCRLL